MAHFVDVISEMRKSAHETVQCNNDEKKHGHTQALVALRYYCRVQLWKIIAKRTNYSGLQVAQ